MSAITIEDLLYKMIGKENWMTVYKMTEKLSEIEKQLFQEYSQYKIMDGDITDEKKPVGTYNNGKIKYMIDKTEELSIDELNKTLAMNTRLMSAIFPWYTTVMSVITEHCEHRVNQTQHFSSFYYDLHEFMGNQYPEIKFDGTDKTQFRKLLKTIEEITYKDGPKKKLHCSHFMTSDPFD